MIEARDLSFRYPEDAGSHALGSLSFCLNQGEKVALMGANGSGKTTLVRCLSGLLIPTSGDVCVDGLSVQDESQLSEIRRRVGMVFQNPDNQIVAATVERDIAFGLENLGVPNATMRDLVSEALTLFRLESYRKVSPHLLSGGERQRLALASIWVMRPRYLILDEPTSLLDPRGREQVFQLMDTRFDGRKMGLLLVTQFPEEAAVCDRLVVIDRGRIILNGPPADLFRDQEALHRAGLRIPIETELSVYLESIHGSGHVHPV